MTEKQPLLSLQGIKKHFPVGSGLFGQKSNSVKAVDGVSLDIYPGQTVGLVGESGCGKSTIGRMVVGLSEPTAGEIYFEGRKLSEYKSKKAMGKNLQMIFQDSYSSLNPRMTVADIIAEPLVLHKVGTHKERGKRVDELLERVGLAAYHGSRYPIEFSGGQRQRIGIARALALQPKLIVCDEPVSALDVSIQAQILNLLKEIQKDLGLSYLFIAHGIQVVKHISDQIAVMYLGKIAEFAGKEELFANPHHPYTKALLAAVPLPDPRLRDRERILLKGDLPSPANPPAGCRFHTRCPVAMEKCKVTDPALIPTSQDSRTACLLYDMSIV
ncbi:oligopeptide/dipeptide ABC transporter, ATPase subunit [Desulfitobacterium hafniense DCB-2]|uniref:Oligopeptide transport ATP-binding protein AppF n=3 Tax=root TaxID=1 RepID=A0A098AX11_DESHA|nr:oligopeptide/dipeptide ABC transporter ATP-binding protein [Desulfitobacterium hafniense]ACL18681.1 oligopeptide/dipeptide ABC transporter, ATPase subunit [Desulfitobacterium hafniense DCB-2]MEA5024224.1 oligopeptide/dipeptide ABC transporter ATP-binding protein [Desulfitobacterium hafniense]CDX00645.1 Oligopeptide transport ATP-binding protein AppF [Desulfitobacterium hafniense]